MKLSYYIIFIALFAASCADVAAPLASVVPGNIQQQWQVVEYEHPEMDTETEGEPVQMEFQENGTLSLTNALNTYYGTWSFTENASKLKINFEESRFGKEISTTWLVLRLDKDAMKLISDDAGPHQYLLLEPQQ